tara:strand:+ start:130 stop:294 length:165 start_codon:yes stop_codon:yes gene_type:complete
MRIVQPENWIQGMSLEKKGMIREENSSIFNEMIKYVHGKNPIELKEHCDKGERK